MFLNWNKPMKTSKELFSKKYKFKSKCFIAAFTVYLVMDILQCQKYINLFDLKYIDYNSIHDSII